MNELSRENAKNEQRSVEGTDPGFVAETPGTRKAILHLRYFLSKLVNNRVKMEFQ